MQGVIDFGKGMLNDILKSTSDCGCRCPSSLLVCLSIHKCGLSAGGRIEGDVRINGHPKEQDSFARVSGYVEQFDTHSAAATVHEALMFSGILRNEKDIDHDTTEAFVDQVRVAVLELGNAVLLYNASCPK